MAFQWYTFLLLNPVWTIVNSFSELQRSLAAMERVFDVLAMEEDKPDRPDAARCAAHRARDPIRERGVRVSPGRPVVRDFNVTVPGGIGRGTRRPERGREDDGHRSRRALSRSDVGADSAQRHRYSRFSATQATAICWRSCSRTCSCSTARCATTSPTADTMRPMPTSRTPRAARTRTSSSRASGRLRDVHRRTRREALRAASSSAWRSRALFSRARRSSSSTKRRAISTPRVSSSSRRRWPRCSPAARPS